MTSTHRKVGYSPTGKLEDVTPDMAATGAVAALKLLEGRWKLIIIFNLFARDVLRFSELERAIPDISQKMLTQQLTSTCVLLVTLEIRLLLLLSAKQTYKS